MNGQAPIETLLETLTAVSPYQSPLNPAYDALAASLQSTGALTLRVVGLHRQLLRDCVDAADAQGSALHQVISSCKRIPPTPLPAIPLGF